MEYKVRILTVQTAKHENPEKVLERLINDECAGGWVLDQVFSIAVQEKPGCLGNLLGAGATQTTQQFVAFRRSLQNE